MKKPRSHPIIALCASAIAVMLCLSDALAVDTILLNNGKAIQGAIVRLDSAAVTIVPWEDRYALYPRGDVYTRDEILAITFDSKTPPLELLAEGKKQLYIQRGTWELSLAASFRSVNPDTGDNYTNWNVPIRAGYFVARNLSVELELMMTQHQQEDMGYLMTASVLVHPKFSILQSKPWLRPFLLIGWGFATGVPEGTSIPHTTRDPLNIFQAGLGFKIGEGRIGLRLEYRGSDLFGRQDRFQQGIDEEGNYYAYRVESTRSDVYHAVLIGFSVFLGP